VVQIGMRATGYAGDDFDRAAWQGSRVLQVVECGHKCLVTLMAEVREQGCGGPVYLSFDIDGLDPAYAPRESGP
jgi:guanidinobutyrase